LIKFWTHSDLSLILPLIVRFLPSVHSRHLSARFPLRLRAAATWRQRPKQWCQL